MNRRKYRRAALLTLVPSALAVAVVSLIAHERAPQTPQLGTPPSSTRQIEAGPLEVEARPAGPSLPALPVEAPASLPDDTLEQPAHNASDIPDPGPAFQQSVPLATLADNRAPPSPSFIDLAGAGDAHTSYAARRLHGFSIAGGGVGGGGSGSPSQDDNTAPSGESPIAEQPATPPSTDPNGEPPSADPHHGDGSTDGQPLPDSTAQPPPAPTEPQDGDVHASPSNPATPDEPGNTPSEPTPSDAVTPPNQPLPVDPIVTVPHEPSETPHVSVPEPSSLGLFGLSLLGLALGRRRKLRR